MVTAASMAEKVDDFALNSLLKVWKCIQACHWFLARLSPEMFVFPGFSYPTFNIFIG